MGITGSVLLIIFKSLISLCFITCLIRISLNLKNDQKNRPHDDPVVSCACPAIATRASSAVILFFMYYFAINDNFLYWFTVDGDAAVFMLFKTRQFTEYIFVVRNIEHRYDFLESSIPYCGRN